jgi:uridine phosphorylase
MNYVLKHHRCKRVSGFFGELVLFREADNRVAICGNFGIGAPAAVIHLEEFVEWGVEKFISVGTAGGLQTGQRVGDLVLCTRAIRDEGCSHHYLRAAKYAYPSLGLTGCVRNALQSRRLKFTEGTSWTIDAPYRETGSEVRQYRKEGVLTVEMEAAALFAAGKCRGAQVASLFSVSDLLSKLPWKPGFHVRRNQAGLERIYQVAVDALTSQPSKALSRVRK